MTSHDRCPAESSWRTGELSTADERYVREELNEVPFLRHTFIKLTEGLPDGSSRTIYSLPVPQPIANEQDAMLFAARHISQEIYREGLEGIDPSRVPFELRDNEFPEEFHTPPLPDGAKTNMSSNRPIGYLRVVNTGPGFEYSIGALDLRTQTHYSMLLN